MVHLTFLLYFVALAAAAAALTGTAVFYLLYHKKAIAFYGMMLIVATLLLFHRFFELYSLQMHIDHYAWTIRALAVIENGAYITGIFVGPFFMHHLLAIGISRTRSIIYLTIAAVYTVCTIAEMFFPPLTAARMIHWAISMPILFGMYGYCIVTGGLSLGKIGSAVLKNAIVALFLVSLLILPFSVCQYLSQKPYLPYFMERPVLFILLFISMLVFSFNHFNRPAYLVKDKLSDYFKDRFSITDRESDIILQVIKGSSNQAIADALFISARTVESHLYNIFQKLEVKNRVQLSNLIQTNQ